MKDEQLPSSGDWARIPLSLMCHTSLHNGAELENKGLLYLICGLRSHLARVLCCTLKHELPCTLRMMKLVIREVYQGRQSLGLIGVKPDVSAAKNALILKNRSC